MVEQQDGIVARCLRRPGRRGKRWLGWSRFDRAQGGPCDRMWRGRNV